MERFTIYDVGNRELIGSTPEKLIEVATCEEVDWMNPSPCDFFCHGAKRIACDLRGSKRYKSK